MNPGDRVLVRATEPGTVKNVGADGDPYVVLDRGCAAVFAAISVTPLAP